MLAQPAVALRVSQGIIAHIMRNAIDFDADFCLGTVKVEYEITDRVLTPKLDAIGLLAK